MASVSGEEAVAIEQNAEYLGVSLQQLMECAGTAVADVVASRMKPDSKCVILAGTGRNGGDGMVAARHLAAQGVKVELVLVGPEERITDVNTKRNWECVKRMVQSLKTSVVRDSALLPDIEADVVVDALLGIGIRGKLTPPTSIAVQKINQTSALKIAVDVPTGIDATLGATSGEAVKADITATFHRCKLGLEKASEYAGEVVVADIGVPPEAELYAGPGDVNIIKKTRPSASHKGDFGRVLIIGGSETFVGAPTLAGLAALKSGVDLVYVAAPKQTALAISQYTPDLITVKLSGEHLVKGDVAYLESYLKKTSAVVFGMGLGLHRETAEAVKAVLAAVESVKVPMVLDADGLKIYSEMKHTPSVKWVLTPHAGEFQILTREKVSENLEEAADQVRKAAADRNAIVLLKGPVDIISDGSQVKFNYAGNPGMTVGGTGDVLAGLVGGFIALGADPFHASVAAAFVNGVTGDLLYAEKGYHILPTDLLDYIPRVIENPTLRASPVALG
ncbi:MAG: NAD(P)H-hydrate dehydratase [Candidatus Bathyarchaeia archaeon]